MCPAQGEVTFTERRRAVRHLAPYPQRIAPSTSAVVPDDSAFYLVMCRDISTRGFSFFAEAPPTFDHLVVELGVPPNTILVKARVVRAQKDGYFTVVGCEFMGRAVQETSTAAL